MNNNLWERKIVVEAMHVLLAVCAENECNDECPLFDRGNKNCFFALGHVPEVWDRVITKLKCGGDLHDE